MRKQLLFFITVFFCLQIYAQEPVSRSITITVINEQHIGLPGVTVQLLKADSSIFRSGPADAGGRIVFADLQPGIYRIQASMASHDTYVSAGIDLKTSTHYADTIILKSSQGLLEGVKVVAKKPFIQFLPDKTVINPEANISNAGATVMDVLEKSPGITVSKDGSIIMKGKPSVLVLIDGKQTQLSGADLQAYLSGLSASQIEAVELIDNPGAKYDASGNAGIINIKMKSARQKGFNGNMNLSAGQGFYPKTGNSLNLNYRVGKVNWFLNYGIRASTEKQNLYTLRKYFNTRQEDSVLLEQPGFTKNPVFGTNVKTGFDFFMSPKTTLGLFFTGGYFNRDGQSFSAIKWMDPAYQVDSVINTEGETSQTFKRAGLNINGKQKLGAHSELAADFDYVWFNIHGDQHYQTRLDIPGSDISATKGTIPSRLDIFTFKADYSRQFTGFLLEAGVKTAVNKTDNLADYAYLYQNNWLPDLSRSNHFLYNEKISAAYASADAQKGKWHGQAGLRYELTSYQAHQLGNAQIKDSAFKKNYGSFFPTGFLSFDADSNNTVSFRIGRRIDRPPFQFLNPFVTTLNKYTYEAGNPFIKPQYTWNFSISHVFKQKLTTEISYNYLRDYFSQIFIIDPNSSNVNGNIIIYTRGNVGSFQNFGLSETYQVSVTKWWDLTAAAILNHKIIRGQVWAPLEAKVTQLNVSVNNQFRFKKGWGLELSGYYQTKSQIDLQEWLKPQGQLDFGISKQILKNKGSLKLSARDITYFQNYSGYSTFQNAHEPFVVKWDSRVVRLSFSWRFGKTMKAVNRSEGGAVDEINRAGNGN